MSLIRVNVNRKTSSEGPTRRFRASSVLRFYAGRKLADLRLAAKIHLAVHRWAASVEQTEFNDWINSQARELGIKTEPDFNYYGYLESVLFFLLTT